jgi:cytochrome c oxidase subunit II
MPRRTLIFTILAALVATGLGIFLGLGLINWFPPQASAQAHNTDRLFYVLVVASVPIFVVVVTVILYSVFNFRMRPGQELEDGPPIHGSTRLEVIWTVVPSVLILALVSYSFVVLHDNEKKPSREIDVNVTGQQFYWSYEYPASVTGGKPVTSAVLYLPANESVRFNMNSKDVIHAFWIPAFRLQEDVVPGITTRYRVTATRAGTYPVVCNLLCGLGHGLMRSRVVVVSPSRFQSWLAAQQSAATSQPPVGGVGSSGGAGSSSGSGASGSGSGASGSGSGG